VHGSEKRIHQHAGIELIPIIQQHPPHKKTTITLARFIIQCNNLVNTALPIFSSHLVFKRSKDGLDKMQADEGIHMNPPSLETQHQNEVLDYATLIMDEIKLVFLLNNIGRLLPLSRCETDAIQNCIIAIKYSHYNIDSLCNVSHKTKVRTLLLLWFRRSGGVNRVRQRSWASAIVRRPCSRIQLLLRSISLLRSREIHQRCPPQFLPLWLGKDHPNLWL